MCQPGSEEAQWRILPYPSMEDESDVMEDCAHKMMQADLERQCSSFHEEKENQLTSKGSFHEYDNNEKTGWAWRKYKTFCRYLVLINYNKFNSR